MQNNRQNIATEVKLSAQVIENIDKLLVLLTFGVITGSLFLSVLIISSFSLAK